MLLHRSGTLYEDMYWIDTETMGIVASETNCNLEQRIEYSNATKKAIQGKEGLLTIHSHPNSFPPSLEDFNANFLNRNDFGIVCCHDGKIYKYQSDELVQEEEWSVAYHVNYKRYRDEHIAQTQVWKDIMKKYKIYLMEV